MFYIGITKENKNFLRGKVVFRNFEEPFRTTNKFWSKDQYYTHWIKELKALINGNKLKTGLITDMQDPTSKHSCIDVFSMYKFESITYIQNRILVIEEMKEKFNPELIEQYIYDRQIYSEDGDKLSEWQVSVQDIKDFLATQTK